jgi:hypothetical protein
MNTMAFRNAQNGNFAISSADIRDVMEKAASAPITALAEAATASKKSATGNSLVMNNSDTGTSLNPKSAEEADSQKRQDAASTVIRESGDALVRTADLRKRGRSTVGCRWLGRRPATLAPLRFARHFSATFKIIRQYELVGGGNVSMSGR